MIPPVARPEVVVVEAAAEDVHGVADHRRGVKQTATWYVRICKIRRKGSFEFLKVKI